MRCLTFFACLILVLGVSAIVRAEETENDFFVFEDRDTNTTDTTTESMTTTTGSSTTTGGSSTTGGASTQVYEVPLGSSNVSVSIPVSGNATLTIDFPAIGNFSAKYSSAGSDLAGYEDPSSSSPMGFSFKGASFFITLFYPNGSQVEGFTFPEPIVVSIGVENVSGNDSLFLYDTTSNTWTNAADTCATPSSKVINGSLVVSICHLTQFAVFEATTKANLASSHNNVSGLIAAVIVIPVVVVGVIIALVAWTLLRKSGRGAMDRDLEMENSDRREKQPTKYESESESDHSESESDKEKDTPKAAPKEEKKDEKKEEKKEPEPVVELKKVTSEDSDTDSSSDTSEKEVKKKKVPEKEESTDSGTDTDTDSD